MLEFSQFEAGYIISQKDLEQAVGYRRRDDPVAFDAFLADVYGVVQQALEELLPHLKVYPALDFYGLIILDPAQMTPEEIKLYHGRRDRLLRVQVQQQMRRSEL
ncbi:hypothetical protein FLX56_13845 [Synechococcus moorigangaii CMS01]|nr:hypothetical protein [Synechococcus moorigangaii CMS01]